jgi:hypothetical protein
VQTKVVATFNERGIGATLPRGLGIQQTNPAHLAFPATVEFRVPAKDLRQGKNTLAISSQDGGWFTWDAMDLTSLVDGDRPAR